MCCAPCQASRTSVEEDRWEPCPQRSEPGRKRVSCGQSEQKQEHGGCGDAEETLSSDTKAWGRFGFTGQLKLLHRLYL